MTWMDLIAGIGYTVLMIQVGVSIGTWKEKFKRFLKKYDEEKHNKCFKTDKNDRR